MIHTINDYVTGFPVWGGCIPWIPFGAAMDLGASAMVLPCAFHYFHILIQFMPLPSHSAFIPFIPLLPCLLEFPQCLIMCCLHMMHFHRINQARKGSRRSVSIEPMPLVCKQSPLSTELPQPHFRLVYRIYCILTWCCSLAASDYCSLNTCNFIFIDIPS